MKKKLFLAGMIAFVLSLMLPSCVIVQDPYFWEVEIEDSYRAQIAIRLDYLKYDKISVDELVSNIEELAEDAYEEHLSDKDVAKYKLALEQMSPNNSNAEKLLQVYNSLNVKFSKWEKQPDQEGFSVWTATERNSGVKVTFKNNSVFDWEFELDEETLRVYIENIAAATKDASTQQSNQTSGDKWLLNYWKNVLGDDYNTDTEQYLKKQYPSGISTEIICLSGEYIDDEDIKEIVPTKDVIIDVLTYHYKNSSLFVFPVFECVSEYYANVYKRDYYKHLDVKGLFWASEYCQDIAQRGQFEEFMQNLNRPEYPPVDISSIKTAKSQQEKDICEVLNAWAYIALGNGDDNPTMELFDAYFDFID